MRTRSEKGNKIMLFIKLVDTCVALATAKSSTSVAVTISCFDGPCIRQQTDILSSVREVAMGKKEAQYYV